ncbi:MAG: alkaline phosphatase [Clostridia bacterium]|nr:alkaline phosphatase [Clostridia bacterium]
MKKFKNAKRWLSLALAGAVCFSLVSCGSKGGKDENKTIILENVTTAKNIILLIGDGMGPNQVTVGEIFKGEKLTMQKFPYATKVETRSANSVVTDSAAAATALATGVRTNNGVVGKNDALEDLTTIVDIAHGLGKRTGIIATEELTGATPMGFSGHAGAREQAPALIQSAAESSNVNFFGSYLIDSSYELLLDNNGYEKIRELDDVSEAEGEKLYHTCIIDAKAPSMSDSIAETALDRLVVEALDYLSQDEDGFFLMAEGSHIDHGGHDNDIKYMIDELMAFDDAVQAALEWAEGRDDTVVIVTADHETGDLQLYDGLNQETLMEAYNGNGNSEYFNWWSTGHSAADVWCFINGADVDFSQYSFETDELIMNTDVFRIMCDLFGVES